MLASSPMDTALPPASAHWLPYCPRLQARALSDIDLVVIHCTELPDLATARQYGERELYASATGNSGHFYIDRDGRIEQYVPLQRIAHHVRGYNPRSVGIELVNRGRWPHWLDTRHQAMDDPYPATQIQALTGLLDALTSRLPQLAWIAGHDALDTEQVPSSNDPEQHVARKRDPGPRFPWPQVLAATALRPLPGGH